MPILPVMNMLNALAPASRPIDPLDPQNPVQAQAALLVAARALDLQKVVGQNIVQLLDPNVGRNLNRSA